VFLFRNSFVSQVSEECYSNTGGSRHSETYNLFFSYFRPQEIVILVLEAKRVNIISMSRKKCNHRALQKSRLATAVSYSTEEIMCKIKWCFNN